jgi:hypothetical protein
MPLLSALSSLASGLVSPITTYLQRKAELSAQNHQIELQINKAVGDRQAQLISQGLAADATWELESIKAGQKYRGYELYVLSIPLIMAFTPWADVAEKGLEDIAKMPGFYQLLVLSVFFANYGIRYWRRTQSDT